MGHTEELKQVLRRSATETGQIAPNGRAKLLRVHIQTQFADYMHSVFQNRTVENGTILRESYEQLIINLTGIAENLVRQAEAPLVLPDEDRSAYAKPREEK